MILKEITDNETKLLNLFENFLQEKSLRPCIVKDNGIVKETRCANGKLKKEKLVEYETYKGLFHTWGIDACVNNAYLIGMSGGQFSSLYGVVEFEDGTVHKVDPESIVFIDRD